MYNSQYVQSQYRGFQQKFQPTGPVQSFYQGSAPTTQFQPSYQNQSFQNQQSFQNPQSFHTANYRGNQPGHDNYLRSDSMNPSSGQFTGMQSAYTQSNSYAAQTNNFHAANYRGNQPGHDNYLRSDSMNPSASANFNAGFSGISQYQPQNPQSFHAANYVGNQPGHDNYLRSDSANPSSFPQYGMR